MCLKHQKDMYWYAQVCIKLIFNYLFLNIGFQIIIVILNGIGWQWRNLDGRSRDR